MIKRLEPFYTNHKSEIYQLTGINQENAIGILTGKGEIALLQFDEDMSPEEKVIEPGFPGHFEGDIELSSDPEHSFIWLRRGKGVYFADSVTKQTGHVVSMRPGSKIFQIFLSNPEEKKWWIVYGVSHYAIDEYSLDQNKKITLDFTLKGQVWPFLNNRFLLFSTNFQEKNEWRFIDDKFITKSLPNKNELTKKLNSMIDFHLSHKSKDYNLASRIIIASTMSMDYSVQWDIDDQGEEENVTITPFSAVQIPKDIQGLGGVRQFSSDGKWIDMSASHKFNGIISPVERFVYHVDRGFPAGLSPPIRLGLGDHNIGGAFMNHTSWGPCYVMQDSDDLRGLKIYKLRDGLKLLSNLL